MKRLLILTGLLLMSASGYAQRGNKYTTVTEFEDDQEVSDRRVRALNRHDVNKVYIFFEVSFSSDTVQLFINNSNDIKTIILTTDESMDLAGIQTFDISQVKRISITKNRGPKLILNFKDSKIWAVTFHQDTLRATALKYPRIYE